MIRIQQHHERRLQTLGGMDGQDVHRVQPGLRRVFIDRLGVFGHAALIGTFLLVATADFLQLADELRQAWITPAIEIQRQLQERIEIGKHLFADIGRRRFGIAPPHFAAVEDLVNQVMHGLVRREPQPVPQPRHAFAHGLGACLGDTTRVDARPPATLAFQLGQRNQVLVRGAH